MVVLGRGKGGDIYIFVCSTIHSTCVARSACLGNKTGKHKQSTIPIAEGRCISFFFIQPVQQVPPLQHRREELDRCFLNLPSFPKYRHRMGSCLMCCELLFLFHRICTASSIFENLMISAWFCSETNISDTQILH